MAIEPNPKRSPNKVTPAREHAPAGTVNTSQAASGGQEYQVGDVPATPSMGAKAKPNGSTAQPRPDKAPGGAVSD